MWEGLGKGGDGMEGENVWRDDWNWGHFRGKVETKAMEPTRNLQG